MSVSSFLRTVFFSLFFISISSTLTAQKLDMKLLEGLKARSIGPAGMSGRVVSIDVVNHKPNLIYIGTASGGLWRSTNGGINWTPLFDKEGAASIGAVAVDQNIPDIIWAGTGEGNPRNSQSSGNGIYKSLDGGNSWTHLGLEKTRNIHRVIIDPRNSDVVYLAVQGSAWNSGPDRGIYKTIDGGKTWKKVLYVDEKTGVADLVIDPSNPNKLIAAMWEFRRYPYSFNSGGPGSGIYVTFDGGKTWEKRTSKEGLPKGDLGRIGLAISPSNPKTIYAYVEAKKNGFYKSADGGFKWEKVSDKNIGNRPFYYADIFVDPENENRIYNLFSTVSVSEDGGRTFKTLIPWSKVHPDHHAFWVHPNDPDFLIEGNDGGLAISRDKGKTWRFVSNLPLAQFYHINVDNEFPYNVYGGMQDNGSWRGPSRVFKYGGIRNSYWQELSFGDGFDVVPYLPDPRYGFSMSQGGSLVRYDYETGYTKRIRPYHPDGLKLRFNWNTGIAQDPFNPKSIYYGSQFLHKSTDMGNTWEILSPDLTTNDPEKQKQIESGGLNYDVTGAENYTTIISIAPSPLNKDVIWVGTDDGNVQLTRDAGKSWTNLIENIDEAPENGWVTQIRASTYAENEAFVVINNYRQGDWKPYIFFTTDYGESWKNIVSEKSVDGYALSVIQDPVRSNLLFAGTEFGLYVSIDKGANWTKWTNGFPTVSAMDLAIQSAENDLVIGTFGRAAYVIDNIQPLRAIAANNSLFDSKLKLFPIPDDFVMVFQQPSGSRFIAEGDFSGENRPEGAMISYMLKPDEKGDEAKLDEKKDIEKSQKDEVVVQILNSEREVIRTIKRKPKKGLNRFYWDSDQKGVRFPTQPKPKSDARERGGSYVLPGEYLVKVSYKGAVDSAMVTVKFDPRIEVSREDLQKRREMLTEFESAVNSATDAMDKLRDAEASIDLILKRISDEESMKDLKKVSKAVKDSIKTLKLLVEQKDVQGIRSDPEKLSSKLGNAYYTILGSFDAPSEREILAVKFAREKLRVVLSEINQFLETGWKDYQNKVNSSEISFFK